LKEKFDGDEERMRKFAAYMTALGETEDISFDFHGIIANTLDAHRALFWIQEEKGPEAARRALECMSPLPESPFRREDVMLGGKQRMVMSWADAQNSAVRPVLHTETASECEGDGGGCLCGCGTVRRGSQDAC